MESILSDPEKAGVVVLLMTAVLAFVRGWVIPGFMHDRVVKEQADRFAERLAAEIKRGDKWEHLASEGLFLSKKAAVTTEKLVEKVTP